MPIVEGKYQLSSTDKFDDYMKAVGVGLITRKLAGAAKPVTEIKKMGENEYYFKTSTTFKTTEMKFKIGQPFTEVTADGRTCKATITMDGERVKHAQECNGLNLVMYRDFTGNEMKMTLLAPNPDKKGDTITCIRIYKKI